MKRSTPEQSGEVPERWMLLPERKAGPPERRM